MRVLADVVSDVHPATMTSPGPCRPGLYQARRAPRFEAGGVPCRSHRHWDPRGLQTVLHQSLRVTEHHYLDEKDPRISNPQTIWGPWVQLLSM